MAPQAVALLSEALGEPQGAEGLVSWQHPELGRGTPGNSQPREGELVAGGVHAQGQLAGWVVQGKVLGSQRPSPPPPPPQVERTEVLRSCSSPVFSRVLALEYFFEEKQPLQFHVFDAEDGATGPNNDTFLGSTECTLGQVCIPTPPPPAPAFLSEIQIDREHEL